ncbi:recombinase RecT [Bacillus mycoides]|uniref:recombinase RecT n=1 Tax=Bacillus mycoides TaxID=1405 RepID=UPI003D1996A4
MANQVTAAPNTDKVIGNFTKLELDTIKNTIATGTTNEQFSLFVQTCVNSELNPFLNHIYCIVYGRKMSIQVSVEGVLHLARQKNGYKGISMFKRFMKMMSLKLIVLKKVNGLLENTKLNSLVEK